MYVKEIRLLVREAGENNPKIWPTHLDILLNREMDFCIKYQSNYQQYFIVTILNDEGAYNKLRNYLSPDEVNIHTQNVEVIITWTLKCISFLHNAFIQHTSNVAAMDISSSVPTVQEIQPMMSLSCEQTLPAQPTPVANHYGSPTTTTSSTPAKRVAVLISLNDVIHAKDLTLK